MKKVLWLPMMLLFCMYMNAASAVGRPEVLLEDITQDMLVALKKNDRVIKDNPAKLVSIIESILVPHVDVYDMSRWVVGRNAWIKANKSQRARFSSEFKDLMIRTYASSLTAYSNQTIIYNPIKGDPSKKKRVQVTSKILESGRSPIHVSYRLVQKSGRWKVYDIIIEGVSLLKGFKSQFSEDIQSQGMDVVIDKMKKHNSKPIL